MGVMEKDPDKFDIRFDDTSPEAIDTPEIENHRLDRLGRRVTLVAILIPCLLGLLVFTAYLDLKKRVSRLDSTGTTEVKKVSQDLESTFSALSVQVAKMEEEFSSRLDSMEKALSSATRKLADVESRVERIGEVKADRQELSAALKQQEDNAAAFQEKLDEFRANWDQSATQIQKVHQAAEESRRRVDDLKTEIKALETEVAAVSRLRPDLKVLELAVKNDQQVLGKKLDRTAGALETRIEELAKRLTELSRKLAAESSKPLAKPQPSAKPPAPSPTPGSGGIVEQDIK